MDIRDLQALKAAYNDVFNTDNGKIVLKNLQERCYKKKTTMDANPNVVAFREGCRAVLLHIETIMDYDVDKLRKELERQEEDG